jgi:hypothetical protein
MFLLFVFVFGSCFYETDLYELQEECKERFPNNFCVLNDQGYMFVFESEKYYKQKEIISRLELGIESFYEIYKMEWDEEDLREVLLNETFIVWGDLEKFLSKNKSYPCIETSLRGGCYNNTIHSQPYYEIWSSSIKEIPEIDEKGDVIFNLEFYDDITLTAFIHEMVHAGEWKFEGRSDSEHDDVFHRWTELLSLTIKLWKEKLECHNLSLKEE